jgi:hypothetical protein
MGWRRERGLLLRVVISVAAVLAVILVFYGLWSLVNPHTVAQRIAFIQMAVGGVGGLTLVAGILVTLRGQNTNQKTTLEQLGTAHKQLDLTREGQITDRFTKAIAQLGATDNKGQKSQEIRLGGIYALERIAKDSETHHWPVIEVLTAYVRMHAPRKLEEEASVIGGRGWQDHPPDPDIQATLTVLRQLSVLHREEVEYGAIDLHDTYLGLADLKGAFLKGASFKGTFLRGADLRDANLQDANLQEANLQDAFLNGANLREAALLYTNLTDAILAEADLQGTNFFRTNLLGANLRGVDLSTTKQLKKWQVDKAFTDENTLLPENRHFDESDE